MTFQSLTEALSGLAKTNGDSEYDRLDVEEQLTDLRLLTSYLENEINVVRHENADFRRDMMTSAMRNHALLTADDVSKLRDKIAELMNGTDATQSTARYSAGGLPRGKPTLNYTIFVIVR